MDRLKVLLTVTDGVDNDDDGCAFHGRVVSRLRQASVFSLSCGIGTVGVDHDGLNALARLSGGWHMVAEDGKSIARVLAHATQLIHARVGEICRIVTGDEHLKVQRLGFVAARAWRIPIDLLILIDQSWSMLGMVQYNDGGDEWSGDSSKLPNTKEATARVIQSLDPDRDRVGVASFCERYALLSGLAADFRSSIAAIRSIDGGYGTSLYRSMYLAIQDLTR